MIGRRDLFAGSTGLALAAAARPAAAQGEAPARIVSAHDFGAVGDGVADDTDALQRVLDAVFAGRNAAMVVIPPGDYRVSRPLKVVTEDGPGGNITHRAGLMAHGARIVSTIDTGDPVIAIDCRATVRFVLIDGLQIQGTGGEGHGLYVRCERRGAYYYNFCFRDLVIQGCGGDGLRLIGNVFEGQIFDSYFRDNGRDGATFGHGAEDTVLSAVHVFGCVFGGNGRNGASLIDGAADMSFHGCYFLLNGIFGLSADHGCTLLSHCGFENNHDGAESFEAGDAGLRLMVRGTLIGCTAYSIYNQTHLVRAYITNQLTMIGCTGDGGQRAAGARLAKIGGKPAADISVVGSRGGIDREGAIEVTRIGGGAGVGARFGQSWQSGNLAWLGEHCLWVDDDGRLRIKRGRPESDDDGTPVGT